MPKKYKIEINDENIGILLKASGEMGISPEILINRLLKQYGKHIVNKDEYPVVISIPKSIPSDKIKEWIAPKINFIVKAIDEKQSKDIANNTDSSS